MLSRIQSDSQRLLSASLSPSFGRSIPLIDWLRLLRVTRPTLGAERVFEAPPSLSEYLLLARLLPSSSAGRVWYLAGPRGARRRTGVSL